MTQQSEYLYETTFNRFAHWHPETSQRVLDPIQFINALVPSNANSTIDRRSYGFLFHVVDRGHKGFITLSDWTAFNKMLCRPGAEYRLALQLLDIDNTSRICVESLAEKCTTTQFNWLSNWANLYFGGSGSRRALTYPEFTQMLSDLSAEKLRQSFRSYDPENKGLIPPRDFMAVIQDTTGHRLSPKLLGSLWTSIQNSDQVPFALLHALHSISRKPRLLETITRSAARKSSDGLVSEHEFAAESSQVADSCIITPYEVSLIFRLANPNSSRLSVQDLSCVYNSNPPSRTSRLSSSNSHQSTMDSIPFFRNMFDSTYNLILGSIAGATGATVVYPIDLVKTRIQNQRLGQAGNAPIYKNSFDCLRRVIQREGFRGLYSGLGPQLLGVAPEKAIKLTVNDFMRSKLTDPNGSISKVGEMLAGAAGGASQVIFTNPLEIVKIRLQMQGEVTTSLRRKSALTIVRELGVRGLYKGASACFFRDIPFSSIYFPAYSHIKKDLFLETRSRKLHIWQLLAAGALAGIPAAYLTTPCDVIKTRLQVECRKGQTSYLGLRHAMLLIWREEGLAAFFRGGLPRVLRSSPQFGVTLAAYEMLHYFLPMKRPNISANTYSGTADTTYIRSSNALKLIQDIDKNFGISRNPPGPTPAV